MSEHERKLSKCIDQVNCGATDLLAEEGRCHQCKRVQPVRNVLEHHCKPPLGNPTREEAIERIATLTSQLETAREAMTNALRYIGSGHLWDILDHAIAAIDAPPAVAHSTLSCADCRMPYGGEGWLDVTLPDEQWTLIQVREGGGGILCANCIVRRASRLKGAQAIRARIDFGCEAQTVPDHICESANRSECPECARQRRADANPAFGVIGGVVEGGRWEQSAPDHVEPFSVEEAREQARSEAMMAARCNRDADDDPGNDVLRRAAALHHRKADSWRRYAELIDDSCCRPAETASEELRAAYAAAHAHGCHWPGNHRRRGNEGGRG